MVLPLTPPAARSSNGPWQLAAIGLRGFEEVAHDRDRLRAGFAGTRAPAAGQHQAVVCSGDHVVEPEVGLHAIAGLLGVGVESRLEVVDDREKHALLGRRDLNLPALFLQADTSRSRSPELPRRRP